MTIDLTDTTTGAIDQALTEARHRLGGMTLGMVLTLIVVTDEAAQYDAIRAANQAAREHPCRVLAIIARKAKADSRLDAEIRVGESSPGETIVLRMYGPLGQHADSVIAPLLVPDVPVVTAGRHRLRLDPGDAVAFAARRHARPGAPGDHRGRDRGRGGQPDRRPDRGLALAAARHPGRADRLVRPRPDRGDVQHPGRRHQDRAVRRAHGHAVLARADRPDGRAAPAGHRRTAGGGTAAA